MKTTLGKLRDFIQLQLTEGKDKLPGLQPGTSWMTRYGLISPEDSIETWGGRGIDIPVLWSTRDHHASGMANGRAQVKHISAGETVNVVDRLEYDQGYNDMGTAPVIEWEGQRYVILSDSPSEFSKPSAGSQGEWTFNEAIVFVVDKLGPSRAVDIMNGVVDLKGLATKPSTSMYLMNAVKKGLIKIARHEGRSPIYDLTDVGQQLVADLKRELESLKSQA